MAAVLGVDVTIKQQGDLISTVPSEPLQLACKGRPFLAASCEPRV
jgi:hypothetical protein